MCEEEDRNTVFLSYILILFLKEKPTRPLSHIALNKQAVQKTKLRNNPTEAALQEYQMKKETDIKQHKRGNVPK